MKRGVSSILDSESESQGSVMDLVSEDEQIDEPEHQLDNLIQGFENDPGIRSPIYSVPSKNQGALRRAYLSSGPTQPVLSKFPSQMIGKNKRSFQNAWYSKQNFKSWIEYSESKDAVFCLPCFVMAKEHSDSVFIKNGFRHWNRAIESFENHHKSEAHRTNVYSCKSLVTPGNQIQVLLHSQTDKEKRLNKLRLGVSVDACRFLSSQGLSFRGHDESRNSYNRGNFKELLRYTAEHDKEFLFGPNKKIHLVAPYHIGTLFEDDGDEGPFVADDAICLQIRWLKMTSYESFNRAASI